MTGLLRRSATFEVADLLAMTIPLVFVFCSIAAVAHAAGDGIPIRTVYSPDGLIPYQGSCAPRDIDLRTGTVACYGGSQDMINIRYENDVHICVYIDNFSPTREDFFVPLRTYEEWTGFSRRVTADQMEGFTLVYGCPATSATDECRQPQNLPDGRDGDLREIASTGTLKTVYRCSAPNGCGVWKKEGSSGECRRNGACGSSAGRAFHNPPDANLCNPGTASAVSDAGATYTWRCAGTGGGDDASCNARHAGLQGCGPASGGAFASLNSSSSGLCPWGSFVSDFAWSVSFWSWYCYSGSGPTLTFGACTATYQPLTGGNSP